MILYRVALCNFSVRRRASVWNFVSQTGKMIQEVKASPTMGGVLHKVLRYLCNETLARLKEGSNEKRAYPESAATTLDRLQLRGEAILLLEIIDI